MISDILVLLGALIALGVFVADIVVLRCWKAVRRDTLRLQAELNKDWGPS